MLCPSPPQRFRRSRAEPRREEAPSLACLSPSVMGRHWRCLRRRRRAGARWRQRWCGGRRSLRGAGRRRARSSVGRRRRAPGPERRTSWTR
eukprot:3854589-Rhodomonas_salina.2